MDKRTATVCSGCREGWCDGCVPDEELLDVPEEEDGEHVCNVCGLPAEGDGKVCECVCGYCETSVFDDVTLADHGMCYDCHQKRLLWSVRGR